MYPIKIYAILLPFDLCSLSVKAGANDARIQYITNLAYLTYAAWKISGPVNLIYVWDIFKTLNSFHKKIFPVSFKNTLLSILVTFFFISGRVKTNERKEKYVFIIQGMYVYLLLNEKYTSRIWIIYYFWNLQYWNKVQKFLPVLKKSKKFWPTLLYSLESEASPLSFRCCLLFFSI